MKCTKHWKTEKLGNWKLRNLGSYKYEKLNNLEIGNLRNCKDFGNYRKLNAS